MNRYKPAFLFIGFGSIISQILLVREFLVSFYGNELSIGIIFASWLFWIGIGSSVGNRLNRMKKVNPKVFSVLIVLSPVLTLIQIILIKFARFFLKTAVGEYISLIELLYFSFIVLFIGCIAWGLMFTLGAKISSSESDNARHVTRVYIFESLGSVLGGLLFSFVLINILNTFQIISFLFFISVSVIYSQNVKTENRPTFDFKKIIDIFRKFRQPYDSMEEENIKLRPSGILKNQIILKRQTIVIYCSLIGVFLLLLRPLYLFENEINKLHWLLVNKDLKYIKSENTRYQNLSLLQLSDQNTVFSDGKPVYNIPNVYNAEVFTHLVMAQSHNPKSVLIIGGGFNGIIKEILKYGIEDIDYVESDPRLIEFVKPFLSESDRQYLLFQEVEVINDDGRNFIQRTEHKYDVILLNVGEPSSAGTNRYFTDEFFKGCSGRLNEDGIIAFSLPSSEDYFGNELKDLNASIYATLKKSFPDVFVIPGATAIFIASKGPSSFNLDCDKLAQKYSNAKIMSTYFSGFLFEQFMPIDRIGFVRSTLEGVKSPIINSDMNPVSYYFDIILWNKFLKNESGIIEVIRNLNIYEIGSIFFLLLIITYIFGYSNKDSRLKLTMNISMFVGGFCGIVFSLLLILNFQTAFGMIYEMIGTMIASNMLGLALGAILFNYIKKRYYDRLIGIIILLIALSAILPYVMDTIFLVKSIPMSFIVMMLYGGSIGMLFGIINKIYLGKSDKLGSIYSSDLFGSSIGSLISSSILIPVYGVEKIRILLIMVLVVVLVLNIITLKTIKNNLS